METLFSLKINDVTQAEADEYFAMCEAEVLRIEAFSSKHLDPSEGSIAQINAMAGIEAVAVDAELFNLIKTSLEWCELTDGAFSIALGALSDIWKDQTEPPSEEAIAIALACSNYQDVVLDEVNQTVYLPAGMSLDLGGVAKGYATDSIKELLINEGVTSAYLDGGGSIYVIGNNANNEGWGIGIANPRDTSSIISAVQISDAAIISSGDYQRYFEYEGVRYHHIIDGSTGYPSTTSIATTIICDSSMIGDILSTAIFVGGEDLAEKLEAYYDAGIIIYEDLSIVNLEDYESIELTAQ